jgi:hypothetical protein
MILIPIFFYIYVPSICSVIIVLSIQMQLGAKKLIKIEELKVSVGFTTCHGM